MGTPIYPLSFAIADLAAAATDTPLQHAAAAAVTEAIAPFDGEIIAITVAGNDARTAGSATFQVRKNGVVQTTHSAVIDGTNPQRLRHALTHETALSFEAGDQLEVVVTTDGGFLPTATTEYTVDLWCTLGGYAPG
jgi:hypothetical protein